MNRDTRRINIETDFYDDQDPYIAKQQEQTFYSTILHKQKGAIAMYNILDTIRLQRVINSFNCLYSQMEMQGSGRASKFSSRLMLLRDLQEKRSLQSQSVILRTGFGEEGREIKQRSQLSLSMKKRSSSASVNFNREAHILRESRKRILEGINKRLMQSTPKYGNQTSSKSKQKFYPIPKYKEQKYESIERKNTSQNQKINQRLQKLENLMKNIRREKQQQSAVIIHEKKHVDYLPKRQNNNTNMQIFVQQIRSLRKQVEQVKEMNESILRQSRQNSLRSSGQSSRVKTKLLQVREALKAQQKSHKDVSKNKTQQISQSKQENYKKTSQKHSKNMQRSHTQNNSRQFLSRLNHNYLQTDKLSTPRSNSSDQNYQNLQKYKLNPKIRNRSLTKQYENQQYKDAKLRKFKQYLQKRQNKKDNEINEQNQMILDKFQLKKNQNNQHKQRLKRQPSITESQEMKTVIKQTKVNNYQSQEKNQANQNQMKYQNVKVSPQDFKLNFPSHLTQDPPNNQSYKDKSWYKQYGSPRIPNPLSFEPPTMSNPTNKTVSDLYNTSTYSSYLKNSPRYKDNNYGTEYETNYQSNYGTKYGTNHESKESANTYLFNKQERTSNEYEKKYQNGISSLSDYPNNISTDRNDVRSGYTNPELLKQLNIGAFGHIPHQKFNFSQKSTAVNPLTSYQNASMNILSLNILQNESKHMPTILERQSEEYKFGHFGNSNQNGKISIQGLNGTNRDWIPDRLGASGYEGIYYKYSRDST